MPIWHMMMNFTCRTPMGFPTSAMLSVLSSELWVDSMLEKYPFDK